MQPVTTTSALVIDDEATIQTFFRLALEMNGWSVATAESAEDGLVNFRGGGFDLVIVDKNLPGMDGVEFVRQVRRENDAIGIIMITGHATIESQAGVRSFGRQRKYASSARRPIRSHHHLLPSLKNSMTGSSQSGPG